MNLTLANTATKSTIAVVLFCVWANWASAALPLATDGQELPSLAPMLAKSMPAVVNISTAKNVQMRENPLMQDPFYRYFFQQPRQRKRQQKNSLGSGVIINASKGYVLTNNHVIDKADKITVTLRDGRQLDAKLLGTDPEADVAVIQIAADNLTQLPIADSAKLLVGDFVVAIGNPFGLGQTVTSGIVSALGRSGLGIEGYEDFIQTDASINPGNSGGALVNLRGELVGMNTAIIAPNGGNVGIGFAIPSNMAMRLMDTLIEHGVVRRGLLGVIMQDLTPQLAKAFDLENTIGAVVSKVETDSAAFNAGIKEGDIIVSINDTATKNSHQIRNIIGLLQIGDSIQVEVLRGKQQKTLTAIIGERQSNLQAGDKLHDALLGVMLAPTSNSQPAGVVFAEVAPTSQAAEKGVHQGDIIVSVNRYRVKNIAQLKKVINPSEALLLNVRRGSLAFYVLLN